MRDHLYLLQNWFEDEELPCREFFCRDCMTLNGLFIAYPDALADLDVTRVAFAKPRDALVESIGEKNQNLPVLILADDASEELADGKHGDMRFVSEFGKLLHALHVRHGFPEVHA